MPSPQYSIIFSAQYVASAVIAIGQIVLPSADPLDGGKFVVSTTAARGTRRSEGITLSAYAGFGPPTGQLQQSGTVDASISGLGIGAISWVRCSATGTPERVASPGVDDDLIGYCETSGRLHLSFGILTSAMAGGDIALPAGGPSGVNWSIKQAGLTLFQTWQSGGFRSFGIGSDLFTSVSSASGTLSPDPATSYLQGQYTARLSITHALTDESLVIPSSHYCATYLHGITDTSNPVGIYAGKLIAVYEISQYTNFAISGRIAHVNATDFGFGRSMTYQGRADVNPSAAPARGGVSSYVDAADDWLRFWSANGTLVPIDGGLKPTTTTKTQASAATVTLTATEAQKYKLVVNGTPGGAFAWNVPADSGAHHFCTNNSNQAWTIKRSSGTGVTIAAGKSAIVFDNGADVQRGTGDA